MPDVEAAASFAHGASGYRNHACRCPTCRAGNTDRVRRRRAERAAAGPDAPVPHGTPGGYANWACRCRPCKDAHAAERSAQRRRARS